MENMLTDVRVKRVSARVLKQLRFLYTQKPKV